MDIINNRELFDCPDNTDDEEKYVLSVYKPRASSDPMEENDVLASLGLSNITVTNFATTKKATAKAPSAAAVIMEQPSSIVDDYTQFIRHTLALKIFGNDLPTEPPKKTDSPELVADLMMLHHATVGSKRFQDDVLLPHVLAVFEYVQSRIPESNIKMIAFHTFAFAAHELQIEPITATINDWTMAPFGEKDEILRATLFHADPTNAPMSVRVNRAEASFLEMLHNVYHLQRYVCASIVSAVQTANADGIEITGLTFVKLWKMLAETHFNDPIFTWKEFSFKPFVTYMVDLYKIWQYSLQEILPQQQ